MSAKTMRRSPIELDDAELRLERGEGVVGDLRPGGGDGAEQGALAGVGHADEADIGDEFEFELEAALLAFGAGLGVARGLVGGGWEVPVAAAALAAAGDDDALAGLVEVGQEDAVLGVVDERAGRDGDDEVLAVLAVHLLAHGRLAALGVPVVLAGEIEEGVFVRVGEEDDAAAVAAVAAIGAALGDVLFAAERDAARAAVTGLYVDLGFVNKHGVLTADWGTERLALPSKEDNRRRWAFTSGAAWDKMGAFGRIFNFLTIAC